MGQKREKAIEAVRIRIILTLYQKLFEIHFLQNENTYQHIYYAPAFTTLILLFPEPTSSTTKPTTITTGESETTRPQSSHGTETRKGH